MMTICASPTDSPSWPRSRQASPLRASPGNPQFRANGEALGQVPGQSAHAGHADPALLRVARALDATVKHRCDRAIPPRDHPGRTAFFRPGAEAWIAGGEVLGAVIERPVRRSPCGGAPAWAPALVEHFDRDPLTCQHCRAGQPGNPGANDGDGASIASAPARPIAIRRFHDAPEAGKRRCVTRNPAVAEMAVRKVPHAMSTTTIAIGQPRSVARLVMS